MYCSSCGKEIPDGSSFCNVCGARTTILSSEEAQTSQRSASDEEIRSELKGFKKTTFKAHLCLECGYNGIMGVSKQKVVKHWVIKAIIISIIEYFVCGLIIGWNSPPIGVWSGFYWTYFIMGIVMALTWLYLSRNCWICPACKQLLIPK